MFVLQWAPCQHPFRTRQPTILCWRQQPRNHPSQRRRGRDRTAQPLCYPANFVPRSSYFLAQNPAAELNVCVGRASATLLSGATLRPGSIARSSSDTRIASPETGLRPTAPHPVALGCHARWQKPLRFPSSMGKYWEFFDSPCRRASKFNSLSGKFPYRRAHKNST
jgi:hypothetical protein